MLFYFDVAHAIAVHDWIIEHSGGRSGMLNIGNLESPITHVQNDDYYAGVEEKVTYLLYAINKNHAFNDGNKRSSIALAAYFLELNGYGYSLRRFVTEMENVAVWVADNVIDINLLRKIVGSILYEDDFSDGVKLELIAAAQAQKDAGD